MMNIPILYGGYRVLRWLMSKFYTAIAFVLIWKKRSRLNTFFDKMLRRIEND